MTWFKVDDNLAFHSKTIAAGNEAMGLWVRAGAWSSQMLTDGFIPEHMVTALSQGVSHGTNGDKPDLAACLVLAGLWTVVPNGYRFHEWNERNPTSKQVKETREKEATRKAEWRAKKAANAPASTNGQSRPDDVPPGQERQSHVSPTSVPNGVPLSVTALSRSSRPDPTRPLSTSIQDSSGGGTEDNARRSKTPPKIRCEQHQQIAPDDPGPNCLRCRDARFEAAEEIRRANAARGTAIRRGIQACRRCDELGWRVDADGHPAEPAKRCDHQPPLRSVS